LHLASRFHKQKQLIYVPGIYFGHKSRRNDFLLYKIQLFSNLFRSPIHLPMTREMIKVNRDKSGRISRRNRDLNQQQYSTSIAGLDGLDVGVSVMMGPSFEVND